MKNLFLLLLSNLVLSVCATEPDINFLPQKTAFYGQSNSLSRADTLKLLQRRFDIEKISRMSEGELKTAARQVITNEINRVIMKRIIEKHNVKPDAETMIATLRTGHAALPLTRRQAIEKKLAGDGTTFEKYIHECAADSFKLLGFTFLQWVENSHRVQIAQDHQEAENFYRMNQQLFLVPETAILSRLSADSEEKAKILYTKLQLGETFASLLRKHGNHYGTFQRGELAPELDAVIFKLSTGQYSHPVKNGAGWDIIHMDKYSPLSFIPFEDVKIFIERQLYLRKIQLESENILREEQKKLNFILNF